MAFGLYAEYQKSYRNRKVVKLMSLNIIETLQLITGKIPTESEQAEILRIIKGLDADQYSIFTKLLIFIYYQTQLINKTPDKLHEVLQSDIDNMRSVSQKIADNQIARQQEIQNGILDNVNEFKYILEKKAKLILVALGILIICFLLIVYRIYQPDYNFAIKEGDAQFRQIWVETDDGKIISSFLQKKENKKISEFIANNTEMLGLLLDKNVQIYKDWLATENGQIINEWIKNEYGNKENIYTELDSLLQCKDGKLVEKNSKLECTKTYEVPNKLIKMPERMFINR